jgi:HK97 family phage prohead protease
MPQLVERLSDIRIEDREKYYTLKVRAITSPKRIERLYGTLLILPEELQKSHKTLEGKPVLKDHHPSIDSVIGKVIQAEFRDNAIYATLQILKEGNENLIRKIEDGLLNAVSVGFSRTLSWDEKENAYIAKNIKFQEISLVVFPADPDATILNEEGEDIFSEAIS